MYARSTTMRDRTEIVDDVIAFMCDEVMPTVTRLDGSGPAFDLISPPLTY